MATPGAYLMEASSEAQARWLRVERRSPSNRARNLSGIVMLLAVFPVAATRLNLGRGGGFLPFLETYVLLAVVWPVSVLLHEVGHAVAARLAGLEPFCLVSGGGPPLVRRRVAGVAVEVRCLPGSGLTMVASSRFDHVKWRLLACYAGGPAMTVALLLLGLALPGAWHEIRTYATSWLSVGAALVLVNGFLLASVVIPLPRGSNITAPRNDFLQMLWLPWLPQERLDTIAASVEMMEFLRLLLLRKYEEACEEARRVLAVDPKKWIVRLGLADLLMFASRHADADLHYRSLLEDRVIPEKALRPGVRALVANNCAWNLFMLDDPAMIERADKLSAEAIADLPKHPSVLGTRGAVLVEKGELVEGQKLIRRALRLHGDRVPKASNLACLAIAAARTGKHHEAERFIHRARNLDRECELIPRAERELAGHQQT